LPDTGIVTVTEYTALSSTFNDPGTLKYGGNTYQIMIETNSDSVDSQNGVAVPMNISLLKNTSLYKDTLGILDSIQ
jgi:hypothetical protein